MAPSLVSVGLIPGQGAGEIKAPPDLAGFQTAVHAIGPGAPGSQGQPWYMSFKFFDTTAGYPNLPTSFTGIAQTFLNNNGGNNIYPVWVYNNIPTAANFQSLISSCHANGILHAAFCFQSEAEGSGSGVSASQFVSGLHQSSLALNTALANLGGGPTYTRANWSICTGSIMDYYQTNAGNPAVLKAYYSLTSNSDVDIFGADFYQHIGGTQSVGLQNDPRFQAWLNAIHLGTGLGTATVPGVPIMFPEYAISIPSYSSANEQARANLMAKDFAYMTGPNSPVGTNGKVGPWIYWYKTGNAPNNWLYPFPINNGSETVGQAGPTTSVWQSMISTATDSGGTSSGGVTVVGVTATITTTAVPPGSVSGGFFVRSMNGATTGTTASKTLNVLKDSHTQPGDLIQIWVATESGTGITFSVPGFTAIPAVSG